MKRPADGTIAKTDRDDPAQQSDALDCFRYYCNAFLDWFKPDVATLPKTNRQTFDEAVIIPDNQPNQLSASGIVSSFKAIKAIENGNLVECTKEEYTESVRNDILAQAGRWLDTGDPVRAKIALMEVKRLDEML